MNVLAIIPEGSNLTINTEDKEYQFDLEAMRYDHLEELVAKNCPNWTSFILVVSRPPGD